jgi:GINS complex subunit 3
MNALKADPRTVDLRVQAPHFYSLGVRILELFEEEEMVDILTKVGAPSESSLALSTHSSDEVAA